MEEEEGFGDSEVNVTQRGRKLTDEEKVWDHNSWDDVEWTEEREREAEECIAKQIANSPHLSLPDAVSSIVQEPAAEKWTNFYEAHSRWFFKDRKWLASEFPELLDSSAQRILEIGCGAGNTIFPLWRMRKTQGNIDNLMIFGCDFATSAVKLVKEFREYDPTHMTVFCHDLTSVESSFEGIEEGSLDVIVAIFVLSAIDPTLLPSVLTRLTRLLKPNTGQLLFRDYGKYDLTQLRFRPQRLIRPDLYIRGDGTAVHYFTEEEICGLAKDAGLVVKECKVDRRLLVNRFRKLTMYRVWIQAKFVKQ